MRARLTDFAAVRAAARCALTTAVLYACCAAWAEAPSAGAIPSLDPNTPGFPASSIVDFSYLLDAPAGKHGFMTCGRDGHFYFQDGTRARFWGINVAKDSVFQPHDQIDAAVDAIARASFNLVRLHHLDDVTGLLPTDRAGGLERLDPDKLEMVDYWVARLKERGIYVYLDLLDFRTFTQAEGIPSGGRLGRAAKPYSVFVEPMLLLQQQYAQAFLKDHVNPYTQLAYGSDPAVCMIEICDENGLLAKRKLWGALEPTYRDYLEKGFNFWLRAKYGSTQALNQAWLAAGSALAPGENLDDATVRLSGGGGGPSKDFPSPLLGPEVAPSQVRFNEATAFAASMDRDYLKQMSRSIRSLGISTPLTAVLSQRHMADLRAVSEELDFVATNFYWDHVFFRQGQDWTLPAFYRNESPLADGGQEALMPLGYLARMKGKPFVIREWNYCWPNKGRAAGMLEMAAYASLQDADAVILFTLDTRPASGKLDFFDVRRDPTRWGLAGVCAKLFLARDIRPAPHQVSIAYSAVDTIVGDPDFASTVYDLGWCFRIGSEVFDRDCNATADLTISSGRSASGAYTGNNLLLYANDRAADELGRPSGQSLAQASGYDVAEGAGGVTKLQFEGTMYDAGQAVTLEALPAFGLADVRAKGYEPVGIAEGADAAYGFRDPQRNAWVFQALHSGDVVRAALDAMAATYGAGPGHQAVAAGRFPAETGEVVRDQKQGVLVLDAPRVKAIAGDLSRAQPAGALRLETTSAQGAVILTSLDGKALSTESDFDLKIVTLATNEGEQKRLHAESDGRQTFALDDMGRAPVRTHGAVAETPTRVFLGEQLLLEIFLRNGTVELARRGGVGLLYCDTPGVKWRVGGFGEACSVVDPATGKAVGAAPAGVWPVGAQLLEIRPE